MFRTIARALLPNPLDWMAKRCAKKGGKRILLGWNRGLGDIALGLYAIVQRIHELVPGAEITFLTRENLRDGFALLEGIRTLVAPEWKRGEAADVRQSLRKMGIDPKSFDLIIEKPSPTDWVRWQRGKVVPRLKWDPAHDDLWKKFDLPGGFTYIGVQAVAETNYGLWRNWPIERWRQLFERLEKFERVKVLLFGFGGEPRFEGRNLIDLRGKTTLFELLSIVKNRCSRMVLPDSGILSMAYYLDASFPIYVLSLWADPDHGLLKQAVPSPNPQLTHHPLIGTLRDLSSVSVDEVVKRLFPARPLRQCPDFADAPPGSLEKVGCILLAGGQGSRLGAQGPKGIFPIVGKSLFQWICEKAPEKNFPIAVMTSPLNHRDTVDFFASKGNFGREVYFFQQDLMPLLYRNNLKNRFLATSGLPHNFRSRSRLASRQWSLAPNENCEDPPRQIPDSSSCFGIDPNKSPVDIARGPDGNGSVFKAFAKSGLADLFAERGIDLLTIVPVENPLADPSDRALIGHARATQADVAIKCVRRESYDEPMGVLVERGGRIEIVEYVDLDPSLEYLYSNTGMMAISFPFFLKMAEVDLPTHWVKKKVPGAKAIGWVWKREKFIFDVLPYGKVEALCYPRSRCYAPVKHPDSIAHVERLLQNVK